jgi:hypothetical protein
MADAATFREYARRCLEVAQTIHSPEERRAMLDMARHWHEMAEKYERAVKRSETGGDVPSEGSG